MQKNCSNCHTVSGKVNCVKVAVEALRDLY